MVIYIILIAVWAAVAISMIIEFGPYAEDLNIGKQMFVLFIIIIGSPFMVVNSAIEMLLDLFLAKGWDDDDTDKYG
jgi:hypothetical protein